MYFMTIPHENSFQCSTHSHSAFTSRGVNWLNICCDINKKILTVIPDRCGFPCIWSHQNIWHFRSLSGFVANLYRNHWVAVQSVICNCIIVVTVLQNLVRSSSAYCWAANEMPKQQSAWLLKGSSAPRGESIPLTLMHRQLWRLNPRVSQREIKRF